MEDRHFSRHPVELPQQARWQARHALQFVEGAVGSTFQNAVCQAARHPRNAEEIYQGRCVEIEGVGAWKAAKLVKKGCARLEVPVCQPDCRRQRQCLPQKGLLHQAVDPWGFVGKNRLVPLDKRSGIGRFPFKQHVKQFEVDIFQG